MTIFYTGINRTRLFEQQLHRKYVSESKCRSLVAKELGITHVSLNAWIKHFKLGIFRMKKNRVESRKRFLLGRQSYWKEFRIKKYGLNPVSP